MTTTQIAHRNLDTTQPSTSVTELAIELNAAMAADAGARDRYAQIWGEQWTPLPVDMPVEFLSEQRSTSDAITIQR